ncbi:MAG: glycosyltransferase family 4 protein, partial [Verrucomicrobia bacterium]|nr:glycosyltransferase family 4 protein [Verrucomicrobiota bacterium]
MVRRRILKIFNRYLHFGGEESSVQKIHRLLERDHEITALPLDSREWTGDDAPGVFGQAWRTVYNPDSRRRLEDAITVRRPDFLLMHNIYPVGSPSLYHAAIRLKVPVVQFAHNYRPFSVSGNLFIDGHTNEESLHGNYWREIRHGAWQNSVLKSAVFALALKLLHRSGWLDSVSAWVCVSEFVRDKFIKAGLPPERVHALRHAWEPMTELPPGEDGGYYLFLGRLVDVKGVAMLLQAWDKMSADLGAQTPELRIAGEGPLEEMVRAATLRNPHVRFLGMISGDAKRDALRFCRAVLVPSVWWEPLGLVTCEAYDYGKPVLAAASGGITETVQDGVTGFLHPPGDVNELIKDIVTLEKLPQASRVMMGLAGRKWLLENTGVDQWRRRFEEIV